MSQTVPRHVLVAAMLVGNVILLTAGWFLVVSPQRHHAASAAADVALMRAQIQSAREHPVAPQTAAPQKQPAIQTSLLYRVEKAMPDTEDQPDLLLELDQVARAAGVTVLTIAPGTAAGAGAYSSIPIQLTAQGDFYGLTDLLYRLRALVAVHHGALDSTGRLFSVDSVQLAPLKGKQLSADISVEAFVYGTAASASTATTTSSTTTGTTSTSTTTTTTTSSTSG